MMKYQELTKKIIGCAYRVYNNFGEKKVEVKRKVRELQEKKINKG